MRWLQFAQGYLSGTIRHVDCKLLATPVGNIGAYAAGGRDINQYTVILGITLQPSLKHQREFSSASSNRLL